MDQLEQPTVPVTMTTPLPKNRVWLIIVVNLLVGILIGGISVWSYDHYQHQQQQVAGQVMPSNRQLPVAVASSVAPISQSVTSPVVTTVSQPVLSTPVDLTKLPLGDNKVSTSPQAGYVYACQTQFQTGGAQVDGPWIQGMTWDLTKKVAIQGTVAWPAASFRNTVQGTMRLLTGNSLPVNGHTGIFPVQTNDPAYQYDRNPNTIKAQTVSTQIPANPTVAATASCVPMGAIGYALNGVAIFNALDAGGRDAVAHEVQDSCGGHPQQEGQYHYHGPSDCIPHANENNALVGYALDGFGIYSAKDANGHEYTDADLDECHGLTSEIEWNGQTVNMYHYVLTHEYPYTIGCFRGTANIQAPTGQQGMGGQQQLPPRPPQQRPF